MDEHSDDLESEVDEGEAIESDGFVIVDDDEEHSDTTGDTDAADSDPAEDDSEL